MNKTKCIKAVLLICVSVGLAGAGLYNANAESPAGAKPVSQQVQTSQGIYVKPLTVVNSPQTYLNKTIIMNAKFDKFSTLGLDYKPAFKSSEDYISFLIRRDDTEFNIPFSEMQLFLKRSEAEKFIELKTNDEIEIRGTLFSDALGDAWVDVSGIKITKKAPEEKK